MKFKFSIFLLSIIFVACTQKPNNKGEYVIKPNEQSKEIRIKYKENGSINYIQQYSEDKPDGLFLNFHNNQNPDNLTFIKNEKNTGTGLVFHNNGLLNNVGQYIDGEKTGWFYVFDKNSVLTGKREYIIIDGKSYMNQWIQYDHNGEPDKYSSSYISLKPIKDTINKGEKYQLKISLEASYFKQYMILIVGPFDENFKLPENKKCDTIKSSNYIANYSTDKYKNGENIIRGIVQELKRNDTGTGYSVRNIYFIKKFYVF
ncbi:MAG: hypothetical protein PHR81_05510 [Bacteroidales bacterium]|jgi:hypothetical protein|nr:hypothetical protein [Bacteroidales bacterium]MDD4214249.1 hypothetical protein [Bacteroidales bacterium]